MDDDYNNDYGQGGEGDIETKNTTNNTLGCTICFVPQTTICNWSGGALGSMIRFPTFVRRFGKQTLKFGQGGSGRWGSINYQRNSQRRRRQRNRNSMFSSSNGWFNRGRGDLFGGMGMVQRLSSPWSMSFRHRNVYQPVMDWFDFDYMY